MLRCEEDVDTWRPMLAANVDLPLDVEVLATVLARPAWHAEAACRNEDPRLFFPGRGEDLRPAKAICAECPVVDDCRAFAESVDGWRLEGIWAGVSGRKIQRTTAAPEEPSHGHGTNTRYVRGCRCDPCRAAAAERQRAYRARHSAA